MPDNPEKQVPVSNKGEHDPSPPQCTCWSSVWIVLVLFSSSILMFYCAFNVKIFLQHSLTFNLVMAAHVLVSFIICNKLPKNYIPRPASSLAKLLSFLSLAIPGMIVIYIFYLIGWKDYISIISTWRDYYAYKIIAGQYVFLGLFSALYFYQKPTQDRFKH